MLKKIYAFLAIFCGYKCVCINIIKKTMTDDDSVNRSPTCKKKILGLFLAKSLITSLSQNMTYILNYHEL